MRYLLLSLCFLLTACPGPSTRSSDGYPVEVTGVSELGNFPTTAAGYTRGKMVMYAPSMKNYSVAYDIYQPEIQNAVTLFFYESPMPLAQLFEAEKEQIALAHRNVTLLREFPMTLEGEGVTYQAYAAEYSYSTVFARREQLVFSQLVLIEHPDRYFKVRSTAPLGQAARATDQTQQLLEEVRWAY